MGVYQKKDLYYGQEAKNKGICWGKNKTKGKTNLLKKTSAEDHMLPNTYATGQTFPIF